MMFGTIFSVTGHSDALLLFVFFFDICGKGSQIRWKCYSHWKQKQMKKIIQSNTNKDGSTLITISTFVFSHIDFPRQCFSFVTQIQVKEVRPYKQLKRPQIWSYSWSYFSTRVMILRIQFGCLDSCDYGNCYCPHL